MNIAIINYNAGNIRSVDFALQRLGYTAHITDDHDFIRKADRVIFPGVGEASTTMRFLKEKGLDALIISLKQPVLGICLGLQLMCSHSEEGDTPCLGIFDEKVKRFNNTDDRQMKVPHMGWNTLSDISGQLFDDSLNDQYVYFVHSYYAEIGKNSAAQTTYINNFSSALQKDNFYATQFHPEKSERIGAQILKNFIEHA